MTAATLQLDSPPLTYARSQSRVVGAEGPMLKMLRDNAPRVVGLLKIPMDLLLAMTGSPWLIGYACFAIIGRIIMITYGNKKHQQERAEKAGGALADTEKHGLLYKVSHPSKYPMEAAAGFSVIGEALGIGYGPEQLAEGKPAGYLTMALGGLAVWLYAHILLAKEKTPAEQASDMRSDQQGLTFGQSQSRSVGFGGNLRQYMKNNPMVVSSLTAIGISLVGAVGGFIGGASLWYVGALACGFVANTVQLLLVRKNDYNIEGAKERAAERQFTLNEPGTFQERIAAQRSTMPAMPGRAT